METCFKSAMLCISNTIIIKVSAYDTLYNILNGAIGSVFQKFTSCISTVYSRETIIYCMIWVRGLSTLDADWVLGGLPESCSDCIQHPAHQE